MNGIISSCYTEDCKEILRKKSITHQSPLSFYNSNFASCGAQRSSIIVKSKTFWVVCRLIKSTFTNHHGFYDRQDIAPLDMWWNSPTNFTSSCDTCMYVYICMFAEKEKLIFPKIESRITNLFKITLMNDRT